MRTKKNITELTIQQFERRVLRTKSSKEKVDMLIQYGKSIFWKDVNSAFIYFEKANVLSKESKYELGQLLSSECLAEYFNNIQGNLVVAEEYNSVAEELSRKLNKPISLSIALRTKGSILESRANYAIAEKLYNECLQLQYEIGDSKLIAVTFTELGYMFWKRALYKDSREYFDKAYTYFVESNDKEKQAGVIHNIGVLYSEEGNYTEAIIQLERSIALKEKIHDVYGLAVSFHTLGTQYVQIQDLEQGLHYFEKSLNLKKQLNSDRVYLTIGNIAYVYSVLEKYDLAVSYYTQAYNYAWEAGDKRNAADYKLYISSVLAKQGKYAESEEVLFSIKQTVEEIADPLAMVNMLQSLAGIEKRKKNFAKSIEVLLQALEISKSTENSYILVQNLYGLADVYLESGEANTAFDYAQRAMEVMQETKGESRMTEVLQICAEANYALSNYKLAYEFQIKATEHQVEQLKTNFSHKNNTLLVQFDVERTKRESEIQRIKAEKLEKELEMKNNELTTLALHLVNKNEFLHDLKEQIGDNIEDTNYVLKRIADKISTSEKDETDWKRFEDQFMQVNPSFSKKLMDASNNTITKTELKICQLLKTGLSSKEVANIMFLSKRTVDTHRHNIHKKLRLKDIQLVNWLLSL